MHHDLELMEKRKGNEAGSRQEKVVCGYKGTLCCYSPESFMTHEMVPGDSERHNG